ncbi:hypothetical protein BS330_27500 [Amycolatopsis keratiniphila subsp. nogabecina]|nr:hypothetical protein BS330_27500 [Amycolatopsis keratiniphila subsp. nogabecina]SDU66043.1 hypothetical protein SAMN04489733_7861 [Amycolatopsis keratiniphila]
MLDAMISTLKIPLSWMGTRLGGVAPSYVARRLADENDRYPYDDRLSLTSTEWPLRPESLVPVSSAK